MKTKRIKLKIQYDGAEYCGWQLQPDAPTVQGEIERALQTFCRTFIRLNGSGRTDAGVHSTGQIAHCDIPDHIDIYKLKGALNGLTKPSVTIQAIDEVSSSFNARFDATRRRYRYFMSEQPQAVFRNYVWSLGRKIDLDYLNNLSQLIKGEHDFEALSRTGSDVEHYHSIVYDCKWYTENGLYVFEISAIRFLRGMVRGIVGTFLEFEQEKRPFDELRVLLESKDRSLAGKNAPAHGLILEEVNYEGEGSSV